MQSATAVRAALMTGLLLAGCVHLAEDEPQDPRCPKNWHHDEKMDGGCRPPDGYTALLYAEFGGTGIYGFGRLMTPDDPPTMLPDLPLALYRPSDVTGSTIKPDAVPIVATETSAGGVYKARIDAGEYIMTCTDPYDGALITGDAEVEADTVALYAIDLDHSGVVKP